MQIKQQHMINLNLSDVMSVVDSGKYLVRVLDAEISLTSQIVCLLVTTFLISMCRIYILYICTNMYNQLKQEDIQVIKTQVFLNWF